MSWLFQNTGNFRIRELADAYHQKTLEIINAKLATNYVTYSPWMSNIEKASLLEPLYTERQLILNDQNNLHRIASIYEMSGCQKALVNGVSVKSVSIGSFNSEETVFNTALESVKNSDPNLSFQLEYLIQHFVPLATLEGVQEIGVGSSVQDARGAVFLSIPNLQQNSSSQLSINIAHELGHQALMLYQSADTIIEPDYLDVEVYSHVRRCLRPAIQAFHATVALAYMSKFLLGTKVMTTYLQNQKQNIPKQFKESLDVYQNIRFTQLGKQIFSELEEYAKVI